MSAFSTCYERVEDKFMKKIPHFRRAPIHAFRMPLDSDGERVPL